MTSYKVIKSTWLHNRSMHDHLKGLKNATKSECHSNMKRQFNRAWHVTWWQLGKSIENKLIISKFNKFQFCNIKRRPFLRSGLCRRCRHVTCGRMTVRSPTYCWLLSRRRPNCRDRSSSIPDFKAQNANAFVITSHQSFLLSLENFPLKNQCCKWQALAWERVGEGEGGGGGEGLGGPKLVSLKAGQTWQHSERLASSQVL